MTFGWKSPNPKFISLSSLFPFSIVKREAKYKILYVSYLAEQYRAIYSSVYGQAGYGAISHLNFADKFFAALPLNVLRSIFYRGYPRDYFILGLRYDKESMLDSYLQHVTFVSSSKTAGETCKEQMAASHLVVIDYLSTAYLESLMMNIPTVCFWDSDAMFLKDQHSDFYDDLIEAKIMHTSPESAASHLLNVYEDPSCWWHNPHTQMLRERWLSRNFGRPDSLVNYLLHLSQS
jgi:putative transferase (TIGR04331 family)